MFVIPSDMFIYTVMNRQYILKVQLSHY